MRQKDYCQENEKEAWKRKSMIRKKRSSTAQEQERLVRAGSRRYLDYRAGKITREMFLEEKKKADEKQQSLREMQEELEKQERQLERETEKMNYFLRGLMKCRASMKLDRELADCLICRIHVYSGHRVEIVFNYRKNDLFL